MSYIESVAANLTKFTIRPTKFELPRLESFVEEVQKRYRGQMATAKILKELMGLRPPQVLEREEILRFHKEAEEQKSALKVVNAQKRRQK